MTRRSNKNKLKNKQGKVGKIGKEIPNNDINSLNLNPQFTKNSSGTFLGYKLVKGNNNQLWNWITLEDASF